MEYPSILRSVKRFLSIFITRNCEPVSVKTILLSILNESDTSHSKTQSKTQSKVKAAIEAYLILPPLVLKGTSVKYPSESSSNSLTFFIKGFIVSDLITMLSIVIIGIFLISAHSNFFSPSIFLVLSHKDNYFLTYLVYKLKVYYLCHVI